MSESQSPPPEEHELEIHDDTHVDEDDDGISTDTSGSLPGSPGADEDADVVTICRWDECHQDLRTLDALFILEQEDLDTLANGKIVLVEELRKPLDSP